MVAKDKNCRSCGTALNWHAAVGTDWDLATCDQCGLEWAHVGLSDRAGRMMRRNDTRWEVVP